MKGKGFVGVRRRIAFEGEEMEEVRRRDRGEIIGGDKEDGLGKLVGREWRRNRAK